MSDLKIGVVGVGQMGRSHINRVNTKIQGATVVACADPTADFGMKIAEDFGIKGYKDCIELIKDPDIDAIICTANDPFHYDMIMAAIEADKYIFCEKPLAAEMDQCKKIIEAEVKAGKQYVQVGYMRRYDPGYIQLKEAVDSGEYGMPLLLHCAHRNYDVIQGWSNSDAVENSMVHEIDTLRWLLGEDYATAEVVYGKRSRHAPEGVNDPQVMILTTKSGVRIDVESYVVNKKDYDIRCEIVCEDAVLNLPQAPFINVSANSKIGQKMFVDCFARFEDAYTTELQMWINATKAGYVDGPTAWDGYVCKIAAKAASKARDTGTVQPIVYDETPDLYKK